MKPEEQEALSAALRGLAAATVAPPPDPERERALLAAFDAASLRAARRGWSPLLWAGGVAAAVLAMFLGATMARLKPGPTPDPVGHRFSGAETARPQTGTTKVVPYVASDVVPDVDARPDIIAPAPAPAAPNPRRMTKPPHSVLAARDVMSFVPWPGASALPPFEGGTLVRTSLPVSMLPSLGLVPSPSDLSTVQADVVVGQDGFARAVRLVQ